MSGVSFIDPSAADAMSSIRDEISKKLDGRLYLASCPCNYIYYTTCWNRVLNKIKIAANVLEALKKFKFFSNSFPVNQHVFPTVHDAVLFSQQQNVVSS
jgi:hypothetical protein